MGDLLDLWFLIIPGVLVLFVIGVILNTIFNIKPPTDGRPIYRAPAGASDSSDSSFSSSNDTSYFPVADSSSDTSSGGGDSWAGDSGGSSDSGSSDSGSSGGGDGGGGGGGD